MSDEPPSGPSMWLRTFGGLAIAIVIATRLMFPVVNPCGPVSRRAEARRDTTDLTAALKAYMTEYGRWPPLLGDGLFLDEPRHAQLIRILRAQDIPNNPRRITFFEAKAATESSGKYRSGIRAETGVFYDPWGKPYRIVLDADYDNTIANPYPDDPPIQTSVMVWSLGKDGQQGAPGNPRTSKGSDDVTSWQ